jgi:hypothetical protein
VYWIRQIGWSEYAFIDILNFVFKLPDVHIFYYSVYLCMIFNVKCMNSKSDTRYKHKHDLKWGVACMTDGQLASENGGTLHTKLKRYMDT